MKNKRKKHLALLMVFAMILSTCIGAYAEALTQDGTDGVIKSQEMPPENETEPEKFSEGNEISSGADLELGQPEEPEEFEESAPEPGLGADFEQGEDTIDFHDEIDMGDNPDGLDGPEYIDAPTIYYPEGYLGSHVTPGLKSMSLLAFNSNPEDNNIEEGQPGSLSINKEAEPVDTNRWEITLTLEGEGIDVPSTSDIDIVLVIDTSGSMKGNRMTKAQEAAKNFVSRLLGEEYTNISIALVSFASDVIVFDESDPFKDKDGAQALIDEIGDLKATGGTFTQAAIRQAKILLADSEAEYKNIVFLSDGEPTYSYRLHNTSSNSGNFIKVGSQYHTSDNLSEGAFNYNRTAGDGTSMTTRIGSWSSSYYYNHGNSAIAESRFAKNAGYTVYTIALEAGNAGNNVLKGIASEEKAYTSSESALEDIFREVAGDISYVATDATVTDPMGEKFSISGITSENLEDYIRVDRGTLEWDDDTETITWNIGNISEGDIVTMSYIVEIDESAEGGIEYPTNKPTCVNYTNAYGEEVEQSFPIPVVSIDVGPDFNITDYEGVYDGDSHSILVGNLVDGDTVYYSTDGGETWDTTNPAYTDVGEYTVKVKVENPNYADRTGTGTVKINPAQVTVMADNKEKVLGEDDPVLTATVSGLIDGESEDLINYSLSRETGEDVGSYEIIPTGDIEQDNYTITFENGTLKITAATGEDLDITGYKGVYDGDSHSIIVGNLVDGDIVYYSTDGGETWDTTNPAYTDVGEYTVKVKVENPNYADRFEEGTVEITARPLEITANSASRVYIGSKQTVEGYTTGPGLLEGHELSGITASGSGTNVGNYPVTFAGETVIMDGEIDVTENYVVTLIPGSLKIRSGGGSGGDDSGGKDKDKDKDKDQEITVEPIPPALEKDEHFAYIIGYPDNTVRPQGNITREEVAAVFYRLLESSTRDRLKATVSDFPDVEANRWSSYHIATLANGNIISGYPDGTFRPGNYITRAEIATIASKFDRLTPLAIDMFSDVSGHWAEEFISSAAQKGWVTGYPDGTFKPDQYITRAEFVTLVNNVLERRVKAEDILPEARQYPDLDKDAWYYEAMQEAINSHHYIRKPDTYEEWTEIYYPDLDM